MDRKGISTIHFQGLRAKIIPSAGVQSHNIYPVLELELKKQTAVGWLIPLYLIFRHWSSKNFRSFDQCFVMT